LSTYKTAFIALTTTKNGINGQLIAITTPTTEAIVISNTAVTSENIRTKNPTVRETRLSSIALSLSSSARPGVVIILFQGENRVFKRTDIEKESSTFFTNPTAPFAA
jgi:hypothetical protein